VFPQTRPLIPMSDFKSIPIPDQLDYIRKAPSKSSARKNSPKN
jgi:hypothetical protein